MSRETEWAEQLRREGRNPTDCIECGVGDGRHSMWCPVVSKESVEARVNPAIAGSSDSVSAGSASRGQETAKRAMASTLRRWANVVEGYDDSLRFDVYGGGSCWMFAAMRHMADHLEGIDRLRPTESPSDLVEQLYRQAQILDANGRGGSLHTEAADEIERLAADHAEMCREVERLAALIFHTESPSEDDELRIAQALHFEYVNGLLTPGGAPVKDRARKDWECMVRDSVKLWEAIGVTRQRNYLTLAARLRNSGEPTDGK